MQGHKDVFLARMKSKRFYLVISATACFGFILWTVYQQASVHPVETWNYDSSNNNRHKKIASPITPGAFSWPVVRQRYLPNYFSTYKKYGKGSNELSYHKGNVVFLHHNKAGGLSIRKCLAEIGEDSSINVSRNVFSYRYTAREHDYWKHAPRTKQHIALYGGYSFGVCDVLQDGRPCSYFTMIRDPYDRAISAYMYCSKNTSKDQLCTALKASEVSVVDWALHHGSFFFRQLVMNPSVCNGSYDDSEYLQNIDEYQHKFSGDIVPCWFKHKVLLERMFSEEDRAQLLQHVLENLENYFAVIGLLEHFDQSMAMYQHVYHLPFRDKCGNVHKNKGRFRKLQKEIDTERLITKLKQELLADPRVNKTLQADILLYSEAQRIFKKQVRVYQSITGEGS